MFGCSVSAAQGTEDLSNVKASIRCDQFHPKKKGGFLGENMERLLDLWMRVCLQTSEKLQVLCELYIYIFFS